MYRQCLSRSLQILSVKNDRVASFFSCQQSGLCSSGFFLQSRKSADYWSFSMLIQSSTGQIFLRLLIFPNPCFLPISINRKTSLCSTLFASIWMDQKLLQPANPRSLYLLLALFVQSMGTSLHPQNIRILTVINNSILFTQSLSFFPIKESTLQSLPLLQHSEYGQPCQLDNNIIGMSEFFRKFIKKEHYPNHPSNIKFKTSFRNCVYRGLANREWKQTEGEDWDLIWCEKEQVDWVYEKYRVAPTSKVNHFRGYYELCRKDMLNKNLKKFKRNLEKQGNLQESGEYDFLPVTYLLPSEYVVFYEEFKKTSENERSIWIMKPTAKCQGKGIFLFTKASDVSKWKNPTKQGQKVDPYVCQKYIAEPLCIGGRKFDMRIYALTVSYQPLTVYLYRSGFARFAHDRYQNLDFDNLYKHLTNVAININSPNYVKKIGGKWFLNDIKVFMMSKYGVEKTNQAFSGIQKGIIKSLIAVQKLVANDKRSFELYGYDFLFDSKMKAWLLEVNGGPSMSANTEADSQLKVGLIDDVMTILDLEKILKGDQEIVGGFDLIYRGKEVNLPATSMYSSLLGSKNNRLDTLKKLAKSTALRLSRQYMQKQREQKQIADNKQRRLNKSKVKPKVVAQVQPRPVYNLRREDEEQSKTTTFTRYEKDKPVEKPHIANQQEEQEEEQE